MKNKSLSDLVQEFGQRAPKSKCSCGHSGDGANSEHDNTVQPGHGPCRKCKCPKFSWSEYTDIFRQQVIKKANI